MMKTDVSRSKTFCRPAIGRDSCLPVVGRDSCRAWGEDVIRTATRHPKLDRVSPYRGDRLEARPTNQARCLSYDE